TFPLMAFISPKLTLYAFLIYPIGIFVMQKLSKLVKNEYYAVQDILGDISSTAQENFSGMSVIQSYVKEPVESKRFQDVCLSYFQTYCKMINLRVWLFIVMAVISGISFLIILNEGGQEVIQGQLDLGGYIAFTLYLEKLAWPTMALGWAITTFQQGSAAIERIDDVLSANPSLTTPQPPLPLHPNQEAGSNPQNPKRVESLEIRNLTFQYTNPYQTQPLEQAPHTILKNISLSLKPGDTVAIVGHVGSGKSTLLSLIPRLHEMPEGAIFINHQDITQVSLKELRSLISYMPQQSFLFSTSIGENIAYGAPEAPQKQIQDYATLAMLHPEVMQFDNHYQTIVGERGLILSGGQRQRLALARTLLVDAPILILDDPFSNLDADTEKLIIEGLRARKVFDNKITLFATHRFSLVSEASWIVLMDQGAVLATGSHRFLMDTQPLYRDLNQLAEQTSSPEEGDSETAPQKREIPVLASHLPMAEESTFGGESLS
ncbi:MAG: ABC transporter ATP-binding protein/permease, partial [Cyanobacteria bacterium]|nr:ABC transporter ATP-binding protein/permease [Cyanobacteriota bacterium]